MITYEKFINEVYVNISDHYVCLKRFNKVNISDNYMLAAVKLMIFFFYEN